VTAESAGADVTDESGEPAGTGAESAGTGPAGTSQAGAGPAGAGPADTGLASLLRGSTEPLSQRYDVALLDLDGVVYLGPRAVPGAPEALAKAAATGMRLAYVTNNASRTPAAVAAQLAGFGVQAAAADVVTSAQAAATLLASRLPPGAAVLVIGSTALRIAVRERGLRPVSTALDRPAAVLQGYAPGVGYPQFLEGGLAVRAGAWFVASNADATLPTPRGIQPGNGSLCQVIAHATGQQPTVAGKPEPPLHAEAVARTGARNPLVVGDRLDTDIEGAVRAGAPSLLVLTGISRPADAVLAAPSQRPSYLAADLAGLLEPQPAVTSQEGAFCCGGWRAYGGHDGTELSLDGAGDPVDGLRALCAAAWSLDQVSLEMIRPALAALGPLGQ
jgi:glycerol-1-phosphatase